MALLPQHHSAFENLVGKKLSETHLALIEDAADGESGAKKWVEEMRHILIDSGIKVHPLKLKEYIDHTPELIEELRRYDVVYFGGGNTYYLRWLMNKVGLDERFKTLLERGIVYAGASAGALVAGPTLKYLNESGADSSEVVNEVVEEGLGFVDKVVIPHWGREDFAEAVSRLEDMLLADGIKTEHITDEQAIIVNGDTWDVIP